MPSFMDDPYTEKVVFPISRLVGCKLNKGQTSITMKFNG